MEKFLAIYEKFVRALTLAAGVIAGVLVLYCGFIIAYEVVCRGVFNAPTEWVMEISTYCIVIAGFLGMGVAYAGKKHIHVDIFVSRMSPKTKTCVEILTSLIGIFYSYIFMVYSWDMAMLSLEYNNCAPSTLGTPLWIPQISMPLGFAILLLQILRTLLEDIVKIKNNDYTIDFAKGVSKK